MKYVYKKRSLVLFAAALDALGGIVAWALKIFSPPKAPESVSRILLIRVDHIGDIIMSTAVISPLRKAFPGAKIDFVVAPGGAELIKNDPDIDRVITFDPSWFNRKRPANLPDQIRDVFSLAGIAKEGKYDVAIDLRGDIRHIFSLFLAGVKCRIGYGITGGGFLLTHRLPYGAVMHETDRNMALLRPLGIECAAPEIRLSFPGEDARKADLLLQRSGIEGRYAVLHPVPGHFTKEWDMEKFMRVARYVSEEKGLIPVVVGSEADSGLMRKALDQADTKLLDLSGRTTLPVLAGVLSGASLFIGVDSAPAHIAAAEGIPAVVLFSGVNDPDQWAPRGRNVRVVYPGKGKYLTGIEPGEVCKVIDEVLK